MHVYMHVYVVLTMPVQQTQACRPAVVWGGRLHSAHVGIHLQYRMCVIIQWQCPPKAFGPCLSTSQGASTTNLSALASTAAGMLGSSTTIRDSGAAGTGAGAGDEPSGAPTGAAAASAAGAGAADWEEDLDKKFSALMSTTVPFTSLTYRQMEGQSALRSVFGFSWYISTRVVPP